MKLASKIVLLCLIAMALMTIVFDYLSIRQHATYSAMEHSQVALELAEVLDQQLDKAWQRGGHFAVAEAVRSSSGQYEHLRIRYVQFNNPSNDETRPAANKAQLVDVMSKEHLTILMTDAAGLSSVYSYVPLLHEESDGGLEISRAVDPSGRSIMSIWNSALTTLSVTVLCIGIVLFAGIHMIGRPLDTLIEKARRIEQGKYDQPIQLSGSSELNELADALNDVALELQTQRDRIREETEFRSAAETQLRHADRLNTIGQLASGIAHELGTPLNVMSGRAGLIVSGKLNETEVHESAVVIQEESQRITKIIRELLDFARRGSPSKTTHDVFIIVQQALDLLSAMAKKKQITVEVAPQEVFEANIEAGLVQQVFMNILMNALQATPPNGSVEIHLSRESREDSNGKHEYVLVNFCDTGSGISEAVRDRIFEPFFTTKEVGEGTGLGLSISYGIVRDHGGFIDVSDNSGGGTCFSVYLPTE